MKTIFPFVVGLSLALNIALAVAIARGPGSPDTSVRASAETTFIKGATTESRGTADVSPKMDPATRAAIESGDLPELVARLRAAGFPPDVIRAMVKAELGRVFIARRKELDPDEATRPFWKTRPADPKLNAELARLSQQHARTLRELLGDDAQDPMEAAYQARRLSGVPPNKVAGAKRILQDYDDMRAELFRGGPMTPADHEKLAAIDKAQRADLAQLLSPEELVEYGVRSGPISDQLRWQLSAFDPSEAEFRAIYQLQAAFAERAGASYGPLSAEQQRQRGEAQKQLNEQIKAALGPERGAAFERAQDTSYRQTSQLVARLNLPVATTDQVWAVRQDIQQQSRALMDNRTLPAEERKQLLATLAEEAGAQISATLGARGFEAYKQYGGQWLQQLQLGSPPDVTTTTTSGQMLFIRQ